MKRSKFTSQIAFILRQGEEGTAVGEICRKAGISEATYYNWRKKYRGLMPPEMKRLRQLEEENGKLKKIVADLSLDKEMLDPETRFELARDCGCWRRAELRIAGAAAQTRMVSVAKIRLDPRKSVRLFKGIICDDISEFESHMPSQAVLSLWVMYGLQNYPLRSSRCP